MPAFSIFDSQLYIMKSALVIVLFFFTSTALAQEQTPEKTRPGNTIFFVEYLGQEPTSAPWLPSLPDSNEEEGLDEYPFERGYARLLLDRPGFRVYFVLPNPKNDECEDGISRMYLHPAAKSVDYIIPLNCPEQNYIYPEDVGFAIYEIDSRVFIEVGWGEPAGPKYRLVEVSETEIFEVACNDC